MSDCRFSRLALVIVTISLFLAIPAIAATTLSIGPAPVSWNVIGLDSNAPATGPHLFPVGTRVCSSVATTNVSATFTFDTANAFVNLRAGSLSTITIPAIGAGQCKDAYFEVDVTQTAAAFDTTRRYHITATDVSGSVTTPVPRELYVEHLISQNRNSITDVKFGPLGCGGSNTCTSVAPGGSMNLVVGNSYDIQLLGGTATQGYNQFEAFIAFPNTIFQIQGVATTYSADNSPYVPGPAPTVNDKLYADACLWENDPNSPAYRSCVGGDFKAGGNNVVTTYSIKIVSGGGTSQPLNTLLYDFSGSSYHYNADFGVGARIANVIDPTAATISKSFTPNPTSLNGISALKITLGNPNAAPVSGYNFVDNLPANLVVAATPAATTSGCGAPTLTAVAGSSSISFSNGTVAANGNCVISVNVTPTATGSLVNTTNHLFIDTNDTGHFATATLTVNSAPPPGTGLCGVSLATWLFPSGFNTTTPAFSTKTVATATALAGSGVIPLSSSNTTPADGTQSWGSNGGIDNSGTTLDTTHHDYFEFAIDTTGKSSVTLTFSALHKTPNGPQGIAVFYGLTQPAAGATADPGTIGLAPNATAIPSAATFFNFSTGAITTGLNPSGVTFFRIYAFNAGNQNSGSDLNLDNIAFTGCTSAVKATIAKTFVPNPIAVNGTSTLTFTLTNTNTTALTGATFTDSLPSGVQVAATPAASTTCTGGPTWAPAAAATNLTFGSPTGGTIPASGSCTVSVNVTATTAGPHTNTSGFLATTEAGTNTTTVGTAPLTAVLPPSMAKSFAPSPILAGGTSRLTFTITNPNPNDAISGVAFGDTFPVAPGAMKVAPVPNPSTSGCGAPTFAPVANAGSITFSAGTIAAGGTCTVAVDITAPVTGTYNNTSGPVSHIINGVPVNGNTASASLTVNPPHPSIGLLKQVATTSSGPWESFLAIASGSVFYRFTVENTGDVPLLLGPATITDNTLNVTTCNAGFNGSTLPVAVAGNDNHIVNCVVGPIASSPGSHTNTASATATFSGNPVNSTNSSATYATTSLTLVKSATETSFTNAGDTLHYSYLVTNNGFAPLQGPVTVADNKTTVTCPAVSTVGDLDNFLDPGESITCTATYIITGTDVTNAQVTNTATASAGIPSVSSNSSSKTVPLSTSADVSLVKTLTTAGPYTVGQAITYTLVVANGGPATATNVQVTDTPTNLTITNVTGGGCVALPCTIASLASGANATITVTATINGAGVFDNTATATATQPDPNPGNNTDSTGNSGSTGASADVSLVKTLDTLGPYSVGQTVSYTITVANAGPSTATSIQVIDTPTNLSITSVTGACVALPCTIASLASGANTTISVTATITSAGTFDNTANATAAEFDPDTSNNTDSVANGGTAAASADIRMTKTLTTTGSFVIGQQITYTLFVENLGPSTATNVQVTDTPSNLSITSVTGGGCAALPCTIASLASGANVTITVTATITAAGAFDNTAAATATESDPNPANNTDSTGNGGTASASADVSIVKTLVTTGPFFVAQSITYTLFVNNAGPSIATNVLINDTPSNLTITSVTGGGCSALPCTLGSLGVNANVTITVTATIDAVGPFDNIASASPNEPDGNDSNNGSDGGGGTAAASADVSLVKTLVTSGPFTVAETITYTLFVANAGPSTATNIQVTDTPTNLTITNVSGGGCAALPCTIASMVSGGNATITVTATITAVGAFDNTATATPAENDPIPANNTDNTGNGGTAVASADVSMVKTLLTSTPYPAGQTINYSLVVANNGPSTATNIQVTDTPTNLSIVTVSGSGCAALPCTIATLASGANTTINVSATIIAAGPFDNSATATGTESDPNPGNNTDSTGNGGTASPAADVSLVKTLTTSGPFTVGQSITYSLVVANAGPSTATNIQVTDTPSNLTITNVSGSGCAALPCTIASLASGANTTITVTATIVTGGAFDNSATATGTESDPNPGNNTDNTGNGGSTAVADISIVKTLVTVGPFHVGQSVSYTLVIHNAGPSIATGIQVTDTPVNQTITGVSGSGCSALPCTIPSLAVGGSTTITVTATITVAGVFTNSATAMPIEFDPNLADNAGSAGNGNVALPSADVSIVKTLVTAGPFSPGQSISYTLVVANAGPSTATSIQVTDTPTNMSITSVSGSGCAALPCTIASLASGANTTINVTATITAAGAFDNSATATPAEFDPNTSNNTDSTGNGGTTNATADMSITKTASVAAAAPGQTFDYTLLVRNNGPSTATGVTVADTLPAGFSLLTATSTQGTCTGTTVVACTVGTMINGATVTITLHGTAGSGSLANTATVTANETDPVPANNTSTVNLQFVAGGPTLSTLGLIIMGLLLAMAGAMVMKIGE